MAAPAEGAIIADVDSEQSGGSSVAPSVASGMDITSAPLVSVPIPAESRPARIDPSCVIHPFYIHKMDSGPVRLMTIAHAFNYRVAVLRDGVRSAVRVRRSQKAETCFFGRSKYFMGTSGDCDVPNSLDPNGRGTSIRVTDERTTGRITGCTAAR